LDFISKKIIINGKLRNQGESMNLLAKMKRLTRLKGQSPQSPATPRDWGKPFDTLRQKWVEVPTSSMGRMKTHDLLELSDEELLKEWSRCRQDITTGPQFSHRGWYHTLYADGMRGKKVLDVGSGFAIDSITFAQHGASLTFVDLAESNLRVVERLCKILGLEGMTFVLLENLASLQSLDTDYDVIMAMGSLHHAPYNIIKPEAEELIKHLKVESRWLQLAYPQTLLARDGKLSFEAWGERTDGVGTPWAEWYDLPKLLSLWDVARFEVVLSQEFHHSNFIWFDLLYLGMGDR
jgi:2-polyprenyl-3-methyl-5-hydroxy-6-metoxy-1,4-benzoquinol methylase